jgi:solute carrier family 34 (sodium-dependent phosphate cotransporter)
VALVGSGQISVAHAVPMILGANVGTTITNTLVSVGHVTRNLEFRRAFAAATVHDFFNLMCVAAILPLELATGLLSRSALGLTELLAGGSGMTFDSPVKSAVQVGFAVVEGAARGVGLRGGALAFALLLTGVLLTFGCLFGVTRNMRRLISGPLEQAINRSLGKSTLIGVLVGVLVTFAVQSSSITTSLLVPMCAAGILRLGTAFPIMLGANIGTTLTALLASMAADSTAGLTIALVHLLFNVLGVSIFIAIPALRRVPIRLATGLAARSAQNPLWVLGYVGGVFVAIPLLAWWIFARLLV